MTARRAAPWPSLGRFAGWVAVGAGLCLAALTPFTIGIFVLPVTLALMARLGWHRLGDGGTPGLASGVGLVALYIGYLNRSGPGDVCTTSAAETTCNTQWNPWPWLAVGSALVVAGGMLSYRRSRQLKDR